MDFGGAGQDDPNFFDSAMAEDISTLQTLPALDVDWSGEMCSDGNSEPAGSPFTSFPAHTVGYPQAGEDVGIGPGFGALGASGLGAPNSGLDVQPDNLLSMAQTSTRAARNGREQQRAQKISDVIDKLKVKDWWPSRPAHMWPRCLIKTKCRDHCYPKRTKISRI